MKYSAQLTEINPLIAQAKRVLVLISQHGGTDELAAGLAFYLSLKQAGKDAFVASEINLIAGNANLYGVGDIQATLPTSSGGDMVMTLGNVVMPDGKVPALEKLDYFTEGSDLKLVFKVVPGQRFEPNQISTAYSSGGADLMVIIGAPSAADLGRIYHDNLELFTKVPTINIDVRSNNANFGKYNLVDPNASGVSEMVAQILPDLNLPVDADIASNLLTGIYDATASLTQQINPETFMSVGMAMQAGGHISAQPSAVSSQPINQPTPSVQPVSSVIEAIGDNQSTPVNPAPVSEATPAPSPSAEATGDKPQFSGFDLRNFGLPVQTGSQTADIPVSTPTTSTAPINEPNTDQQPEISAQPAAPIDIQPVVVQEAEVLTSPEESSLEGEFNPSPDWLTPKVYKGGGGLG